MSKPLEDYVEVSERITLFYEKYPEGSLRCKEIRNVEVGDQSYLVYVAQAFRSPTDEAPAEGAAWEPVPGKTNFTRDSELMNAETSAWGRAIAALGFEVKRGIASRQEVINRRDADGSGGAPPMVQSRSASPTAALSAANGSAISEKQLAFMDRLLREAGVDVQDRLDIGAWAKEKLTGGQGGSASAAIEAIKSGDDGITRLLTAAKGWVDTQPTVPGDERDLQPAPASVIGAAGSDIEF